MANSQKPSASPSIVAAAVVAILAALLTLFFSAVALFSISSLPLPNNAPEFPPFAKTLVQGMMGCLFCVAIFGIVTGIGLIRLRNWARISILVWAAAWIFFSAFGVLGVLLIGVLGAGNLPAEGIWVFRLTLAAIYGLPLAIGVWWLILFNRKAISAQFQTQTRGVTQAEPVDLSFSQPQKPRCPVAVVVLAWFYVSSGVNIIFLPFLPFHIPALFFGRLIQGTAGTVIFISMCVLLTLLGIGLLKLKRWSYDFTIGLQVFFLTSGIITSFSPNLDSLMRSVITGMNDAMHLPVDVYSHFDYVQLAHFGMYFGLLFGVAILVLLFYYRERFLEAASAAKS